MSTPKNITGLRNSQDFYFRTSLRQTWDCFTPDLKHKFINKTIDIRESYLKSDFPAPEPKLKAMLNAFNIFPQDKLQVVIVGKSFSGGHGLCYADTEYNEYHKIILEMTPLVKYEYFSVDMMSWAKQGVLMLPKSFTNHKLAPKNHDLMWKEFLFELCLEIDKRYSPIWGIVDYPELTAILPKKGRDIYIPEFLEENLVKLHNSNPFDALNKILLLNNKYAIKWF